MADFENYQTYDPDPFGAHERSMGEDDGQQLAKTHELDKPKALKKLAKLKAWWFEARTAQQDSRFQMALDEDFYDGLQWSEEDAATLANRGQGGISI